VISGCHNIVERGIEEKAIIAAAGTEVARLQVFNRTSSKVSSFIIVYRLYRKIKMREAAVEEQIQ